MNTPLISIIVPVFNVASFLDECLSSLVEQTYTHWEALLIDDASTDGLSLSICQKWANKDERMRVIHLEQNGGLSYARNRGLENIQGDYVTFLDSDDYLDKTHIESLYQTSATYQKDIAITGISQRTATGRYYKSILKKKAGFQWSTREALLASLMDKGLTSHVWNKIYPRSFFDDIRFPEGRVYEDFVLWIKLIEKANGVVHTGGTTYNYRRHGNSITKVQSVKHTFDFFIANIERYHYLEQENKYLSCKERSILKLWYRKTLLRLTYELAHYPIDEEQQKAYFYMQEQLKKLGIQEIRSLYRLKMLGLSLQKRYYEIILS